MWPRGSARPPAAPGAGVPRRRGGPAPGRGPGCPHRGEVPLLPARDFLFHPGAASRQWEHQRLEILARLTRGDCPVLVATVEGLLQRTLPPDVFVGHCRAQLSVGQVCQLEEVADFLVQAGYTRCDQVEGTGQFALRGHPGRVLSPAWTCRCGWNSGGRDRLPGSLRPRHPAAHRPAGRPSPSSPAGEVLAPGGQALPRSSGPGPGHGVRHPDHPGGLPPPQALVCLCDTPRVAEQAKHYLWQLGEDVTALLEQGVLTAKHPVFAQTFEGLCHRLAQGTLLYLDAFLTGALPVPPSLPPLPSPPGSWRATASALRPWWRT